MKRVEFVLTMPNVGSWNGRWSGEREHYAIVRRFSDKAAEDLVSASPWHYSWSDGWGANVSARVMEKGERAKKSSGFCGYDWMVGNILRWGTPRCQCEWKANPRHEDEEECIYCRTSRKVTA